MNKQIEDWRKQVGLLSKQVDDYVNAIKAFQKVCPHEHVENIGHDSHKDCYECVECGYTEWI